MEAITNEEVSRALEYLHQVLEPLFNLLAYLVLRISHNINQDIRIFMIRRNLIPFSFIILRII